MPAVVPIIVAGATYSGAAAAIGTAIAGAAIGTTAATAIGAGVIGAGASLATGKSLKESLTTGVISGLTAGVGSTIGSAMAGAGSAADAAFVAADAAQLAGQGLSEAAIAQNLIASGVNSAAAQTAAQMAASGATESAISGSLGSGTLYAPTEAQPAPIETATQTPVQEAMYPGTEVQQTYTPAPDSLQSALPELGVETQATTAPLTTAPGSFASAISPEATASGFGLLSPIPSPSLSVQDAFRAARLANNLMQQPQQQQQQQLPQQAMVPPNVDYNELLGLLSQRPTGTGLLGTQFKPQPTNLTSLIG